MDWGSDFEVYFEGFDQWNEPGEKLEMDRVRCVGIQRIMVCKLHDAAELITLGSRREVGSDVGFEDAGNLGVEFVDFVVGSLFLSFGGSGFPAKTTIAFEPRSKTTTSSACSSIALTK